MSYLVIDTETTGLVRFDLPSIHPLQPHLVQLAAILFDDNHNEQASINVMVKPCDNWIIPDDVVKIHGITTEHANQYGIMPAIVAEMFYELSRNADLIVAHNIAFDIIVMENFLSLFHGIEYFSYLKMFCTMKASTDICKINNDYGGGRYKWPKLSEAYRIIVGKEIDKEQSHGALYDAKCCAEIYRELMRRNDLN